MPHSIMFVYIVYWNIQIQVTLLFKVKAVHVKVFKFGLKRIQNQHVIVHRVWVTLLL